jgi:hypothetical protein
MQTNLDLSKSRRIPVKSRISDGRLLQICQTGACPDLPPAIQLPAFRQASRLLAARAWIDIFAPVAELERGRFAVHVYGRWVLSFDWSGAALAHNLALERIKE